MADNYTLTLCTPELVNWFAANEQFPFSRMRQVLRKIIALYQQARRRDVIATCFIVQTYNQCKQLIEHYIQEKKRVTIQLRDYMSTLPVRRVQTTQSIRVDWPLSLCFLVALQCLDDLLTRIDQAYALGLFPASDPFYRLKRQRCNRFRTLTNELCHFSFKDRDIVTVYHVINQAPSYQTLCQTAGPLEINALIDALYSPAIPDFYSEKIRERLAAELKNLGN